MKEDYMSDVIRYNLHYCLNGIYQNRIIIPSYDSNGQLNYFVGRDFYKGGMKYKIPLSQKILSDLIYM